MQSKELLGSLKEPVDRFCMRTRLRKLVGPCQSEETAATIKLGCKGHTGSLYHFLSTL